MTYYTGDYMNNFIINYYIIRIRRVKLHELPGDNILCYIHITNYFTESVTQLVACQWLVKQNNKHSRLLK